MNKIVTLYIIQYHRQINKPINIIILIHVHKSLISSQAQISHFLLPHINEYFISLHLDLGKSIYTCTCIVRLIQRFAAFVICTAVYGC